MYDVIIVGAGPAGLSAALILGRCRRRVLIIDHGRPRNAYSQGVHGFLTRDNTPPADLLRLGREDLIPYGVEFLAGEVVEGCVDGDGFRIRVSEGTEFSSRKLLLATGVVDCLPEVEGIRDFYGRSVFHCPYCDGWEVRDRPLAVYARGGKGVGMSLSMKTWSDDIALCTDGPAHLRREVRRRLDAGGVRIYEDRIARLEGRDGALERIVFRNGDALPRHALFFNTGQFQRSELARQLGCQFNEKGTVSTDRRQKTGVPGLYVAGDAARDVQFVVVAAAEGAKAAVDINKALAGSIGPSWRTL